MEDNSFDENLLDFLSFLFRTYEPVSKVKEYAFPGQYAAISSLFLSISDMFDGLAKDVDIMEGEVLFHEKLNNIRRKDSRIPRKKKRKRPITLYREALGKEVSRERAKEMWNSEPEDVKNKYRKMAL